MTESKFNIEEIKAEAEKLAQGGEDSGLATVCLADVEKEEIEWLWYPYIAKKKLTIFSGEEGIGKSWITCALASVVSNGYRFPQSENETPEATVLFLALEDGLSDTLKPRLELVGAKHENIHSITAHFSFDDLGLLRFYNLIEKMKPAIVFIDPFFSYLRGGLNINLATEIRPITSKLAEIAEECNSAFVLIRHIGKSKGFGDARSAGLGSIDLRAVCRSEILIGRDPENARQGAMVQIKNNLAEAGAPVGYELKQDEFFWLERTALTADKILSSHKSEDDRSSQMESVTFLRETLAEGERLASEVKKEAAAIGITEQMLRTARAKLQVEVYSRGFNPKKWYWALPYKDAIQTDQEVDF